jgi:RND family efflux transporter MFP subunit
MSRSKRSFGLYSSGAVIVVVAAAAVGYLYFARGMRVTAIREAQAMTADHGPRIEIVTTTSGPTERVIKLLGDARSGATTTLYGKVAGYLKSIPVDKGDKVTAGQVVAEIESPELEQQYAGASADLANKQRNLDRAKDLFAKGAGTQVALQQAETDVTVAQNTVAVLGTTRSYQKILAPYNGRVTQRFVDPGALITNAQTNSTGALAIMTISDDTRLRIYAYVQQADAPFVHNGDPVEISDASNSNRTKMASVTRMTGELDQKTRTMLIEVDVDNSDGFLIPGSFAYLALRVPLKSSPQIPVTALLTRGDKSTVAVVDNDTVHFKPITVSSTDGAIITVADGVKAGDKIAINVPDEVIEGSHIQPVLRQ